MNGFRSELLDKILGINGHLVIQPMDSELTDYNDIIKRIEGVDGVSFAVPFVEGQILASASGGSAGALVRGMNKDSIDKLQLVSKNVLQGSFDDFDNSDGVALGSRLARSLGVIAGDRVTPHFTQGSCDADGCCSAHQVLSGESHFRDRHERI